MRIISFAWTTPALLARRKTCTRRKWLRSTAERFQAGELVQAYDKQARFGGKRVGIIRLTAAPYLESTTKAPESDWEAEGFAYLESIGALVDGLEPRKLWQSWRELEPAELWVVRFEVVEIEAELKDNGPPLEMIPEDYGEVVIDCETCGGRFTDEEDFFTHDCSAYTGTS